MNWEAIGAIGEVVGALGVIATLGYLAIQIRQNTASVRASTLQEMTEGSASFLDLLASDAELGRIFIAGAEDLETLTTEERARFQFVMLSFLRRIENMYQQASQNRVLPDEWAGLRASCLSVMSRPGSFAWFGDNSQRFNPPFANWLNHEIRKPAAFYEGDSVKPSSDSAGGD